MRPLLIVTGFVAVLVVAGCPSDPNGNGNNNGPFSLDVPSAEKQIVPGGLTDTRPFFGTLKTADDAETPMGDFLLASCGCGDWRVLFVRDDGTKVQFPVSFYVAGQYTGTGVVDVYGVDGANGFSGSLDQDGGTLAGKGLNADLQSFIDAARGSSTDPRDVEVEACGWCHIGEDSVFPLPPTHPDRYKSDPTVCLECHSVNGQ